ncbi:MAG TPA: D-glycerate dehydrogenase, partial [Methylococcales bacterium]|nr:D-glycerate dehydrogenase [Methylococcales bacterium]
LVKALKNNWFAGAGLDVFEHEPTIDPALLTLDNVTLLPHLGSATEETRRAMGLRVIDNIKAFFSGQTPRDLIC